MLRLALVVLAGCNTVFGLDTVAYDAGHDTGDSRAVTVRHGVLVIEPDELGGYQTPREQLLDAQPSVTLDDGTMPMIDGAADLSFSFQLASIGQSYRLQYTPVDAQGRVTLVSSAATLDLFSPLFGRLERGAVTQPTSVTLTFPQMSRTSYVFTTGLRTARLVNETPTQVSMVQIDWKEQPSLSGPLGLPSAAERDRLYLAEYELVGGIGAYYTIKDIASTPLTLQDGAPLTLALSPAAAGLGRCVRLEAQRAAEQTRLLATVQGQTIESLWAIEATPDPATTPYGGILLAYDNTTISDDIQEDVAYPNPFTGERQVVRMTTTSVVDIGGGMTRSVVTAHYAPLPVTDVCDDATSHVVLVGTVAIPTNVAISGTHVTWSAGAGAADMYLVDVVTPATDVTTGRYVTTETSVDIDASALTPGEHVLRISTVQGIPNARTGDFATIAYPYGVSVVYGQTFTTP